MADCTVRGKRAGEFDEFSKMIKQLVRPPESPQVTRLPTLNKVMEVYKFTFQVLKVMKF